MSVLTPHVVDLLILGDGRLPPRGPREEGPFTRGPRPALGPCHPPVIVTVLIESEVSPSPALHCVPMEVI